MLDNKKLFILAILFLPIGFVSIFANGMVSAQEIINPDDLAPLPPQAFPPDEFYIGRVMSIAERTENNYGFEQLIQTTKVLITSGELEGKEIQIEHGSGFAIPEYQRVKEGDVVVIAKTEALGQEDFYVADKYRLPSILWITILFFGVVILFSRFRGLSSIVGLAITVLILVKFIVPKIVAGGDPLMIGLIGASMIAVLSIYTAHGFNKRTSIALLATIITLGLSSVIAIAFVAFSKLFGGGTEAAFFLQTSGLQSLDLRGILLAGIIIGALGVLDDITTAQSAAVDEIKNANPALGFGELYKRGISVGKEHITSLVNTLVLAYAGASLPLLLLFSANPQPLWVTLNGEFIAEEVIRTLVGSTTLVLAVPIATLLAAYFFSTNRPMLKLLKRSPQK